MYSSRPIPFAISHRGLRREAPENTIAAFAAAIAAGADAIELDVHASADGMVFVHHDFTFASDDGGAQSSFSTTPSSEIRKARLGGDNPIPTLDEVIEAVGDRAGLFIEIKPAGIESDVVRCLRRHAEGFHNFAVHSFDHRVVKRMLELLPSVRTGILQVGYPIDSRAAMRAAGASDLWQHVDFVDSSLVADVHASGGRVIVWTANSESQWKALRDLGVDGICTDHVDAFIEWRNAASSA